MSVIHKTNRTAKSAFHRAKVSRIIAGEDAPIPDGIR